jgi:cytoskeletal protein CcmA (bactofilin family)
MKGKGGKTVMPRGWNLNGDIESQSDVQVGCQITGGIRMTTSNHLEVLHGAAVVGSIKATDVVVRGYVEGEIDASGGTVSIEEGATIRGKVIYTGIRMDGGEHQMELVHVPRPKGGAGQAS